MHRLKLCYSANGNTVVLLKLYTHSWSHRVHAHTQIWTWFNPLLSVWCTHTCAGDSENLIYFIHIDLFYFDNMQTAWIQQVSKKQINVQLLWALAMLAASLLARQWKYLDNCWTAFVNLKVFMVLRIHILMTLVIRFEPSGQYLSNILVHD